MTEPGLYKARCDVSDAHCCGQGEAGTPKKPGILYNNNLHNYLLHNAREKALCKAAVVSMAFC